MYGIVRKGFYFVIIDTTVVLQVYDPRDPSDMSTEMIYFQVNVHLVVLPFKIPCVAN